MPPNGLRVAGTLELTYSNELLPRITPLPTSVLLDIGAAGGARVAALNADFYQCFKDSNLLDGATNPAIAFTAAQPTDAGVYMLPVRNSAGAVTSLPITVTVIPEPATVIILLLPLITTRKCLH